MGILDTPIGMKTASTGSEDHPSFVRHGHSVCDHTHNQPNNCQAKENDCHNARNQALINGLDDETTNITTKPHDGGRRND